MTKKTELNDRISKIRSVFCGDDNHKFAEILGLSDQRASSICTGAKSAGPKMLHIILDNFPRVQRAWLILGEGDMLKPEPTPILEQVNNSADGADVSGDLIQGTDIHSVSKSELNRLITLLENKDKQIDRLITILEERERKQQ